MTTNKTRKSIASAAVISLGLVGLTALPAQAALSSVSIAPLSGTNSNFLADAGFVLQASGAGAGASEDIVYLIEGAIATDLNAVDWGHTAAALTTIDAEGDIQGTATVETQSVGDNSSVFIPSTTWQAAKTQLLWFDFDESEVTVPTQITITAFRDDVTANDRYDAGEAKLGSYTFTVHPASTITSSLTTDAPAIGATTVNSTVKFGTVNMASIIEAGNIGKVTYLDNGANAGASGADSVFQSDEYSSSKDGFVVASGTLTALSANDVIVARPFILDESTGGTGSTTVVAASVIDTISANQVATGADFSDSAVADDFYSPTTTTDAVRSGSGTFTVSADLVAIANKSNAGATVTWKVKEQGNNTLSGTISSGGKTLTNTVNTTQQEISVDVLSDASGKASLELSYSGLKAGDKFTVQGSVLADDELDTTDTVTYTVVDSAFKEVVVDDYYGGNLRSVKNGDSVTVRLQIRDNFDTPFTKSTKIDYLVDDGSSDISGTTSATTSGFVDVTWTDNNTADDLDINLEVSDVDTVNSAGAFVATGYTKATGLLGIQSYKTLDTAARVVISNDGDDTGTALATSALAAVNERMSDGDAGTFVDYITATVFGTNGAALDGVPVTFSAEGLYFGVDADGGTGGTVEKSSANSITVYTNASGVANVFHLSNLSGKYVITATSGAGSDSTAADAVTYAAAATSSATTWSFAGTPTTAQPGSTFKVTAKLTDKFGNPVGVDTGAATDTENIIVSYTGPGIVFGTLPDETAADGTFSFSVLLGANDSGVATITAGYSLNADQDTLDFGDFAAQYTVTIGDAPAGDYGTLKAWTVDQGDGTAKVYVKYPTLGEKVRIGHQTGGSGSYETIFVKTIAAESDSALTVNAEGYYIVRTIDLDSGTNRIRVTVGDNTEVQVRYNE